MPMMTVVARLNNMLNGENATAYSHAATVVAAATSVAAAVEASGVYDGDPAAGGVVPAAQIDESKAVFGALPHSVDQSILAALKSAFARHAAIRVAWMESLGPMQVHVQESINHDLVIIHLLCPSGETFHPGTP
jgi:hypothetical protein